MSISELKPMSARARRLEPILRTSPYEVLLLASPRGPNYPRSAPWVGKDPSRLPWVLPCTSGPLPSPLAATCSPWLFTTHHRLAHPVGEPS